MKTKNIILAAALLLLAAGCNQAGTQTSTTSTDTNAGHDHHEQHSGHEQSNGLRHHGKHESLKQRGRVPLRCQVMNGRRAMNTFFPLTGSEADWNAAYYRLEDYFRSLRVINKVHQSQLILQILESAASRHAADVNENPTTLAMEQARTAIDHWFENILGPRERIAAAGLISLLAANALARWPKAFLADQIPPELRQELQENEVRAGPDLQVSSMVPALSTSASCSTRSI